MLQSSQFFENNPKQQKQNMERNQNKLQNQNICNSALLLNKAEEL